MDDEVPWVRLLSMSLAVALEALHEGLAEAGHPALRPAHGYTLNAVLAGHDTASSIAPVLGMTKQGAAKLVATLLDEGYLEPVAGAGDARRRPVALTARGHDAVETSVRLQAELEARWGAVAGERRMSSARAALERVLADEAPGGAPPLRPGW